MSDRYPRVLILNGSGFGNHSATAITLTNLFQGWPAECLALAHSDGASSNPGAGICRRIWGLSSADVPIDGAIRRLLASHTGDVFGRAAAGMPSGLAVDHRGSSVLCRNRLHSVASAWSDLLPLRPPAGFHRWVAEFQPQVIYSMLGSARIMGLVLRLGRNCRVPIVPHLMDDWPTTHYRGWSKRIPRAVLLSRLRTVLRRSVVGMSIGHAMAAEFQRRYRLPFEAFMNCVDVNERGPKFSPPAGAAPLKFVYAGGLHLRRWEALQSIGRALVALRDGGFAGELVVHAPIRDAALFEENLSSIPTIRLGATLAQEQMSLALRAADVLVHVESFDPGVFEFTRLSVSTKIPQYMASGKPILAYGPAELASCRYVRDSQCGILVGELNQQCLQKAIRALRDPDQRAEWGRRGWEIAQENHDGAKVRERFRQLLAEVAGSNVAESMLGGHKAAMALTSL